MSYLLQAFKIPINNQQASTQKWHQQDDKRKIQNFSPLTDTRRESLKLVDRFLSYLAINLISSTAPYIERGAPTPSFFLKNKRYGPYIQHSRYYRSYWKDWFLTCLFLEMEGLVPQDDRKKQVQEHFPQLFTCLKARKQAIKSSSQSSWKELDCTYRTLTSPGCPSLWLLTSLCLGSDGAAITSPVVS